MGMITQNIPEALKHKTIPFQKAMGGEVSRVKHLPLYVSGGRVN